MTEELEELVLLSLRLRSTRLVKKTSTEVPEHVQSQIQIDVVCGEHDV